MQRVVSKRLPKFCWAGIDAIDAINAAYSGRELTTALGVYQGLTRMAASANDGEHNGFEAKRAEIYARCGVSGRTFDGYLKRFKKLGLIEVEASGGSRWNTWILTDPPSGPPVAAAGATAAGAGDAGATAAGAIGSVEEQNPLRGTEGAAKAAPSSPSGVKSKADDAAQRLCRFLTTAAGENPDEKRYGSKQLANAAYLLEHKDRALVKAIVEWAHTRPYWAPKVIDSTRLRRWWDELLADYRAAQRPKQTKPPDNHLARMAARGEGA